MVDINRSTEGVFLPPEVSSEIWQQIQEASIVMRLAPKVRLTGAGVVYREILTDSVPQFVGETERKPVDNPTVGTRTFSGHKMAVVQTYSDEFRRDLPGLFNALVGRLPGAFAKAFDLAALHGIGAPVADFDTLAGAQEIGIENVDQGKDDAYAGFLEALAAVPNLNAWTLNAQGRVIALSNRDANGGAILNPNILTNGSIGSIVGVPVYKSEHVTAAGTAEGTEVVGIAGDWTKARWGQIEAISIDISDNPVFDDEGNLITAGWQDNMIGVRAELHVGFMADDAHFARLTNKREAAAG